MKNIHVLPTDKPSRLSILNNGKLNFGAEFISSSNTKAKHTYITNSEEIKEGDWFIEPINKSVLKLKDNADKLINSIFPTCKKIILTTDQDLIKEGVQAIDDEFLEWFVKNPSCEWVEIEKMFNVVQFTSREFIYKIIIPKEEQTKCYCGHTTYCDCGLEEYNPITKQKIDMSKYTAGFDPYEEPKQETTLEEVAEKFKSKELFKESNDRARKILSEIKSLPIQERMYSEDEVLKLLEKRDKYVGNWLPPVKWLEQFKNK